MRSILSIAALALASLPLCAQKPGPHLEVRTASGQTTFHIGERIPLILSFTGPKDNSYSIDTASYDRSGRLSIDTYTVTPTVGISDPLAQYFQFGIYRGGGVSGTDNLSAKPVLIKSNLNEWVRFDEPGTYTLTVISNRVEHTPSSHYSLGPPADPVSSSPIELHIIPATPRWQEATLKRILRELAVPIQLQPGEQTPPQQQAASADLRYLASPGAIEALAMNLRDDRSYLGRDTFYGLVGLARNQRDLALAALNHRLDDPSFPISQSFLDILARLRVDHPQAPTANPSKEEIEAAQAEDQRSRNAAWETIAHVLPRKDDSARPITAQTLVAQIPSHPSSGSTEAVSAALRESFAQLPAEDQARLLANHWASIQSRSLLPDIRSLARLQSPNADPGSLETYDAHNISTPALARWYALEPEAATLEIMHQIGSATPYLSAKDINYLPPQSFPQFESLWMQAFLKADTAQERSTLGSLLVRFGTGAVSSAMTTSLESVTEDHPCNTDDFAIAYLIRFDPTSAKRFLAQTATSSPTADPSCYAHLDDISKMVQDPILSKAAIAALASPNPSAVSDALTYLTKFGDESARQPILDRYRNWSKKWSDHDTYVNDDPRYDPENPEHETFAAEREDHDLGVTLILALLTNQGWIPDAKFTAAVLSQCGGVTCDRVKSFAIPDFTVSVTRDSYETRFRVGPFESTTMELFEAKLDQFPKGTTFTMTSAWSDRIEEQNQLEASMPALFARHGMKLITPTP